MLSQVWQWAQSIDILRERLATPPLSTLNRSAFLSGSLGFMLAHFQKYSRPTQSVPWALKYFFLMHKEFKWE